MQLAQFERYVADHGRRLRGAAILLCGNTQEGEDLAQETLVRVFRALSQIQHSEALPAYAHRTLARLAWRRQRRHQLVSHSGEPLADETSDTTGSVEDRLTLQRLVTGLPRRQRDTLVFRFYLDLSISETAAAMKCSPGTVKSQTARGLAQLRGQLETPQDLAPLEPGASHADR